MQQKDADDAKRRIVMARVGRADDRSRRFDLEFWERVGPEGRFAAAWEMVAETQRMRGAMGSNPDFRDLFCELNAADARYLIVGAYAVIYHTEPRYTKDIEIWVEPTAENAARVHAALSRFGAPVDTLSVDDLTDPHLIYQVGIEPNRIDILMAVTGLEFEACYQSSVVSSYDGVPIRLLALDDLITAKRAAGRLQDQLDLQRLEEKKSG